MQIYKWLKRAANHNDGKHHKSISTWFLMLGSWSFRHYFWDNWKRYVYVENDLDAAGAEGAAMLSAFYKLCHNPEILVWVYNGFPFFR